MVRTWLGTLFKGPTRTRMGKLVTPSSFLEFNGVLRCGWQYLPGLGPIPTRGPSPVDTADVAVAVIALNLDAEVREGVAARAYGAAVAQGLTLVHFSAQRKHFLLDSLGTCS